jgi:hypothetical protein
MTVHIDGDVIKYRCAFAAERRKYTLTYQDLTWEFDNKRLMLEHMERDGLHTGARINVVRVPEPVSHALNNVRGLITDIMENLGVGMDEIKVYLSGDTNFRTDIASLAPYKGNREDMEPPIHGPAVVEYLVANFPHTISEGQEADDDIATAHYAEWLADPMSTIIASVDKDFLQLPGLHYDFVTRELRDVSTSEARFSFWQQMLMGDTVDNVKGIPGVGRKISARKLAGLDSNEDYYFVVREEYLAAFEDKADEYLLANGRLLWLRRKPGEMWNPPNTCEVAACECQVRPCSFLPGTAELSSCSQTPTSTGSPLTSRPSWLTG